jgi:hypothetical protein
MTSVNKSIITTIKDGRQVIIETTIITNPDGTQQTSIVENYLN